MYKIKALDFVDIAIAARQHFIKMQEMYETGKINTNFSHELNEAAKLRKWAFSIHWDADAELMIDEMPF